MANTATKKSTSTAKKPAAKKPAAKKPVPEKVEEIVEESTAVLDGVEVAESIEVTPEEIKTEPVKESSDSAEIAALKAQIELLTKMVMANQGGQAVQPIVNIPREDTVTIIHLKDYTGTNLKTHIELSNLTIDLRSFGEERVLTRQAFEELVGRYRGFFDRGTIAPGPDAGDVATRYGLKKITEMNIPDHFLANLSKMKPAELEELYLKLGEGHRRFMLEYWRRKVAEGASAFKDLHKIEILNQVSDGKMDSVIMELNLEKQRARAAASAEK